MTEALADGWGTSTPRDDNFTREYAEAQGDLAEALGQALSAPTLRTDDFVVLDRHLPFAFENIAVLLRPVFDADDPVLGEIAHFFRPDDENTPFLVMSLTPLPSMTARGWSLIGHPPLMLRPPGSADPPTPAGVEIIPVRDAATLATFDHTLIEAFPVPEMRGRRSYDEPILGLDNQRLWLGLLDGEPVATAGAWISETFVDVEWISVAPNARGRGVGEAMTWMPTLVDPELPAMLIASDLGRPIYERMGFLPISRLTLWTGVR